MMVHVAEFQRAKTEEHSPLQGKIASWWVPDQVVVLDKNSIIPLSATGKISKKELRKQLGSMIQAKL